MQNMKAETIFALKRRGENSFQIEINTRDIDLSMLLTVILENGMQKNDENAIKLFCSMSDAIFEIATRNPHALRAIEACYKKLPEAMASALVEDVLKRGRQS